MISKAKLVGGCLLAALLLQVAMASSASAAQVLNLKEKGKLVPDNTTVPAGWFVAIEEYGCSSTGTMDFVTNGAAKDLANKGTVGAPTSECQTVEFEEETTPPLSASRRRARSARRHVKLATTTPSPLTNVTFTAGTISSYEVTAKKKGTLLLSKALIAQGEEAGAKCAYESKTKISGAWPSEEYPDTANIESEFGFKLVKGSAKSCAKTEEGYVEAWLGPEYEEFEAELFTPVKG
jgi:hypothetical protein